MDSEDDGMKPGCKQKHSKSLDREAMLYTACWMRMCSFPFDTGTEIWDRFWDGLARARVTAFGCHVGEAVTGTSSYVVTCKLDQLLRQLYLYLGWEELG